MPVIAFSQKLKKNEADEFTKTNKKETSWELVTSLSSRVTAYVRALRYDNVPALNFRIINAGKVIGIAKNDELMIKTDKDSIVTIKSVESQISCKGCGSTGLMGSAQEGIDVTYVLFDGADEILKNSSAVKIRVYTSKGYLEFDVRDQSKEIIKNELALLD